LVVIDEPGAEPQLRDGHVVGERVGLVQDGHAFSPLSFDSRPYTSSVTGSSHSLLTPSPGVTNARWLNQASAFAPCQCFVPAGTRTTVPGSMLIGSSPSAWYQPDPAVHIRIWSPPPSVPWWTCQLLRHPGSKLTLLTGTLPPT